MLASTKREDVQRYLAPMLSADRLRLHLLMVNRGHDAITLYNMGRMCVIRAREMRTDVAAGLSVLHDLGYAHHDIKPENVVYEERTGRWSIIDFDVTAPLDTTPRREGTIPYIPPFMYPGGASRHPGPLSFRELNLTADYYAFALLVLGQMGFVSHELFGGNNRSRIPVSSLLRLASGSVAHINPGQLIPCWNRRDVVLAAHLAAIVVAAFADDCGSVECSLDGYRTLTGREPGLSEFQDTDQMVNWSKYKLKAAPVR